MEIFFKTAKLQKICNSGPLLLKAYGRDNGKRIRRRLAVLEGASCLADVPTMPPERCHPLKGTFAGCFAVDVLQPHRIVFAPADDLRAVRGAKLQPHRVTAILILEIVDYH